MLMIGALLGFLTLGSLCLTFEKLPPIVKWWLKKHPLTTDFLAAVFAFFGLTAVSASIPALIGAAITGLGADFAFKWSKYLDKNPDVREALDKKADQAAIKVESWLKKFILSL